MYELSKQSDHMGPTRARTAIAIAALLFFFMVSCGEAENEVDDAINGEDTTAQINSTADKGNELGLGGLPQAEIPEGYDLLSEAVGDLDGDGINEKVIAFNTTREGEMGFERELRIYSEQNGLWSLWHTAVGPVLSSESGGTMGDPFEKLEIRKGQLEIFHFGGSADKWSYSHAFEHSEGNWLLANATLSFFRNCDYSETYTYDLANGTGYHSKHTETCTENGVKIESILVIEEALSLDKTKQAPLLEDFVPGGTEVPLLDSDEPYFF
ncbi:MAG: hypothetical protein GQ574_05760 [Crocinitomix sp.]|nr:hypothetical protein [Crocinitomix sp.]